MANIFNIKALFNLSKILAKTCNKIYLSRMISNNSNSCANNSEIYKYPFLSHKEELLSNQTLMFHLEGTLLKSSSMFPYFMLVAFEAGSPLRALILLLLYPFVCFVSEEIALNVMVFVSFFGVKVESFRLGRAVLPKFFLEDVGYEGFDVVMAYGKKIGISDFPRIMIDGFLRYYLGFDEEVIIGRELKVICGYFVGLIEANNKAFFKETLEKHKMGSDVIGFACQDKSLNQQFFSHCKKIYFISEAEKRTWHILPKEKYPKPLIFHDGRLAFRPTPFTTLAMVIWTPFGFILFLTRAILGLLLPYNLSIPILYLTGMGGTLLKPKSFTSQSYNKENSPGVLYVCNHKTLFDPIFASVVLMKPLTAVTYSLSKVSEFFAPIKTIRLSRNTENDFKLIKEQLSKGDLAICPEGTTCREPYLLRFSPMFAEISDDIVPMAINIEVNMFYATTASGFKWLDPIFLLMNPYITCNFKILEKLDRSFTCQFGGKSKIEVANYVQAQIGKALGFECTSLTRKDKYLFLAGNEGIV